MLQRVILEQHLWKNRRRDGLPPLRIASQSEE
jgi:hypothetical protein